jgi:hypothetical protein
MSAQAPLKERIELESAKGAGNEESANGSTNDESAKGAGNDESAKGVGNEGRANGSSDEESIKGSSVNEGAKDPNSQESSRQPSYVFWRCSSCAACPPPTSFSTCLSCSYPVHVCFQWSHSEHVRL